MPFLRAAAERRIIGARLLAPEADDVPPFPLEETVAALRRRPAALAREHDRFATGAAFAPVLLGGSASAGQAARRRRRAVRGNFSIIPANGCLSSGYLPLTFTPASPLTSPTQEGNNQVGSFSWRWANQPLALETLWTPGVNNVITTGAVMNFESQNGLKTDGIAGPQVWTDLLADVQSGKGDANPWNYVLVSQSLPESATVYSNGTAVYSTPVNTGVAGATTANGTFPRLRPVHGDHHVRHQSGRLALRGPRHPVGELFQRG